MTSNIEAYIGLLIQIPLVGIFVWFSLQLISIFLKSMEALRNSFIQSIDARDKEWRLFIEQERKANHDAIAHMAQRFADEIRILSKEVAELRGSKQQ
jgi:hypothetical protein